MSAMETVRQHPIATGAFALVVFVGVLWMMSGSGDSAVQSAPAVGAVDGGTANQDALQALQMHSMDLQASTLASAAHDDSAYKIAQLQLEGYNNNQQTARFQIESDAAVAMKASTLTAQVQQATINAQVQAQSIQANRDVSINSANLASQQVIAGMFQQVTNAQIAANTKVATQSWIDKLFG